MLCCATLEQAVCAPLERRATFLLRRMLPACEAHDQLGATASSLTGSGLGSGSGVGSGADPLGRDGGALGDVLGDAPPGDDVLGPLGCSYDRLSMRADEPLASLRVSFRAEEPGSMRQSGRLTPPLGGHSGRGTPPPLHSAPPLGRQASWKKRSYEMLDALQASSSEPPVKWQVPPAACMLESCC
jgi:hypothetical protein